MPRCMFQVQFDLLASNRWHKVEIPTGAVFKNLCGINSTCCLWFEGDPTAPMMTKKVLPITNGRPVPDNVIYLGTIVTWGGERIQHVYEQADSDLDTQEG